MTAMSYYDAAMSAPVFISFSREHDVGYVSRLAAHLAVAGVTARYDRRPMSESWWETYTRVQIEACRAVIAVTSPEAHASARVTRELDYARSQGKPVLTIAAGEMPGPELLGRLRPEPADAGPLVPVYQGKMGTAVGIETRGGVFSALLREKTTVPAEVTEIFTTGDDYQSSIKIRVMAGNGQALGGYELLIEPAPRGMPQIAVTFRVEQDGAFRLLAKEVNGNPVPIRSPADPA